MTPSKMSFTLENGQVVHHDVFAMAGSELNEIVIFLPGFAIKPRYYARFATFLAERGAMVVVVNYRGIGHNRESHLYDRSITLSQWGARDLGDLIYYLHAKFPHLPLRGIGHSMGGYLFGLTPHVYKLSHITLVCVPHGRLVDFAFPVSIQYRLFSYLVYPFFRVFFPCAKYSVFGLGEDVPIGVISELTTWTRHAQFIQGLIPREERFFHEFSGALCCIHVSDDRVAPTESIDMFLRYFENASVCFRSLVDPREHKVKKIGHIGYFRRRNNDDIWLKIEDHVNAAVSADNRQTVAYQNTQPVKLGSSTHG